MTTKNIHRLPPLQNQSPRIAVFRDGKWQELTKAQLRHMLLQGEAWGLPMRKLHPNSPPLR